jgi:hypothetical protein
MNWKESEQNVDLFQVLLLHYPTGGTEGTHDKLHSGQPTSGLRTRPSTSWIQNTITHDETESVRSSETD